MSRPFSQLGRYPFSPCDLDVAAAVLSSTSRDSISSVEHVVNEKGWELVSGGEAFESSGWTPLAIRSGHTLMLLFHGTDVWNEQQALLAAQSTVLGCVPHALYFEAFSWSKGILRRHEPRVLMLGGFSQGGALAEMLAVHFESIAEGQPRCLEACCAITFDSPSFAYEPFARTIQADAKHAELRILQFKSAPHFLNTAFPAQGTEVRRVMIPHVPDEEFDFLAVGSDAASLLLDCIPAAVVARRGASAAKICGGLACKAAVAHGKRKFTWFLGQHNMTRMYEHLHEQHVVTSWPTQAEVATPRLNTSLITWRDVVPVLGPLANLHEKLTADGWAISRDDLRSEIEEHVRNTPGFTQCSTQIPRGDWNKVCGILESREQLVAAGV